MAILLYYYWNIYSRKIVYIIYHYIHSNNPMNFMEFTYIHSNNWQTLGFNGDYMKIYMVIEPL